jgi:dihydrofolate synthase/folylpolyglutamate synthase
MTEFEKFINGKPLAYKEIDIERMPKAFETIQRKFEIPKIIHVVGTNGKGTTGRFIAEILKENGFKVGHYTSPHISKINERFWRDGDLVSNQDLDKAHKEIMRVLPKEYIESLSYFEYTTLLNLPLFENSHYLVLEAGLGGEFDATNVFPKNLSVFTPIGFDHQSFLGNSIREIALTKLRSLAPNSPVVIAKQKFDEVYSILDEIATLKSSRVFRVKVDENLTFLEENFETAKKALQLLGIMNLDFKADDFQLQDGRFQQIKKNIWIDVGHNPLSAERVSQLMYQKAGEKFVLVYNSLDDKPFSEILEIFKPHLKRVEILNIKDERAVSKEILEESLDKLEINFKKFKKIDKREKYLVFGSFRVIEKFLALKNF